MGRLWGYLLVALIASLGFSSILRFENSKIRKSEAVDGIALGRSVYIAEGCIHCHSQYVRPEGVGRDTEFWGPPTRPEDALAQRPVLIGNRRQGPDLANVGLRRQRDWNRLHLINPGLIVPGSRMPSFAHLFEPGQEERGEALLDYLDSLKPPAPSL